MTQIKKQVLSILVDNKPNILVRICSLFARRKFNMSSVTGATTYDPKISLITIVSECDSQLLDQIVKQIGNLQEVKSVSILPPDESLLCETLIVKLELNGESLSSLRDIVDIYEAHVINLSSSGVAVQLTGKPSKIDAFLEVLSSYKIKELCRSGVIGLGKNFQSDWWESHN